MRKYVFDRERATHDPTFFDTGILVERLVGTNWRGSGLGRMVRQRMSQPPALGGMFYCEKFQLAPLSYKPTRLLVNNQVFYV